MRFCSHLIGRMRSNVTAVMAESIGLAECLDRLAARRHADRPVSSYRLQFNREFRFVDARALVPYLRALGITHCYASPLLKCFSESTSNFVPDRGRMPDA